MKITSFALFAAMASAATHASPLFARDHGLNCTMRTTGSMVITSRKDSGGGPLAYLTLSHDAEKTLIVDENALSIDTVGTRPRNNQHFTFYTCTERDFSVVLSGEVGVIQPGVLGRFDANQQGCLTATADTPTRLVIKACASGPSDATLARQWFMLGDYDQEGGTTTLELIGGPDGSYAYRDASTESWADETAVTVTGETTGKVLAFV